MKKTVAFLLTLTMLLTSVSVFATENFFKAMSENYTSYSADMTVSFVLDKPLLIIDELVREMEDAEDFDPTDFINIRNMAESIFGSTSKSVLKLETAENYKKIKLSMEQEGTVPLTINKNLTTTTAYKNGMWIDIDFTDSENPKFLFIMNNPIMDKYLVMDLGKELPDEMLMISEIYSTLLTPENIQQMNEKSTELLKKYAKITKSGRTYTLKFDDMSAKLYFGEVFQYVFSMMEVPEGTAEVFKLVEEFAENNVIFGEDGLQMTVKLSAGGKLSYASISCQVDLNVCDIAENYGENVDFLDRDKSFVSFTMKSEAEYKNVGEKVNVTFPTLTAENSINLNDMMEKEEEYEYLPEVNTYEYYYITQSGFPVILNNDVYVPLRPLCEDISGYSDEMTIAFEDGTAKITMPDGVSFKTLEVTEFSNVVVKDGEKIILDKPVQEIDGSIMLESEFLFRVLNLKVSYVSTDFYDEGPETGISLSSIVEAEL